MCSRWLARTDFCTAWQTHDEETGVWLLTEEAKKRGSEEKGASFFTASPLGTYEIGRGKKLKAEVYRFPLILYRSDGGQKDPYHPRYSQLSVVKTGNEE
jgi:hypothetical protein